MHVLLQVLLGWGLIRAPAPKAIERTIGRFSIEPLRVSLPSPVKTRHNSTGLLPGKHRKRAARIVMPSHGSTPPGIDERGFTGHSFIDASAGRELHHPIGKPGGQVKGRIGRLYLVLLVRNQERRKKVPERSLKDKTQCRTGRIRDSRIDLRPMGDALERCCDLRRLTPLLTTLQTRIARVVRVAEGLPNLLDHRVYVRHWVFRSHHFFSQSASVRVCFPDMA